MKSRQRQQLVLILSTASDNNSYSSCLLIPGGGAIEETTGEDRKETECVDKALPSPPPACGHVAPTSGGGTGVIPACGGIAPTSRSGTVTFLRFFKSELLDSNRFFSVFDPKSLTRTRVNDPSPIETLKVPTGSETHPKVGISTLHAQREIDELMGRQPRPLRMRGHCPHLQKREEVLHRQAVFAHRKR